MLTPSKRLMASFLLAATAVVVFQALSTSDTWGGDAYRLLPPAVANVHAQDSNIATILNEEAGMAAYFQLPSGIDLESVESVFRTTERATSDYIIGSVPVTGYNDTAEDVHVFVSRDGWIVAYYLAADPASKIVDVRALTSASTTVGTKLEIVLQTVAASASVGYEQPNFYHFQYPEATHFLMITGSSFTVEFPSAFRYYERGISTAYSVPSIDGSGVSELPGNRTTHSFFTVIDPSLLSPNVSHDISENGLVTLFVVYREQ